MQYLGVYNPEISNDSIIDIFWNFSTLRQAIYVLLGVGLQRSLEGIWMLFSNAYSIEKQWEKTNSDALTIKSAIVVANDNPVNESSGQHATNPQAQNQQGNQNSASFKSQNQQSNKNAGALIENSLSRNSMTLDVL